ncbi:MAG: hypothetical protein CM15mP36_06760 [Flavobacteriales bacterium]|jgi:hypothetical protein|nr:MAG: hypothetical protein CM15mP36_06760 [Flavobacteriales bacterium]|tara:strand:- start:52 stop:594 length:543 start_codon:yes stop_codon:yes gene_type:complete
MRDISTLKLNFFGLGAIGLFLFAIFKLKSEGHIEIEILEIIKGYYEFTIPLLFVVINLVVYRVTVNSNGIHKSILFPKINYRIRTWSEIKHFINVTEIGKDNNGKEKRHEVIWFVDFNDKVCFRISKQNPLSEGENMKKIMSVVKQREVEYPEKLEFDSPFWYKLGISKVDYSKKTKSDL